MVKFNFDFSEEAKKADELLAEDMKKLGGLSDEEIAEVLPKKVDQDELKALIAAVNAETSANKKKALLLERLAGTTDVVKNVVKGLVKAAAIVT